MNHPQEAFWPAVLLGTFILLAAALAIEPVNRGSWWLENLLVFVAVPFLVWTYQYFRLSTVSYTLIFIFLFLHEIGAHYTYAEVPFGFWLQQTFEFTRNNFDRIVHFSFGLLLAYPVREVFHRVAQTRGVWGYWFPVELTFALSAVFEICEWLVVLVANPEAGQAYLGTQGDEWDAIKDMAVAGVGASIAMTSVMLYRTKKDPAFRAELVESVRIKSTTPLGEIAYARIERKAAKASRNAKR